MPRTPGGIEYEVPEPLEENVMGQAPTETYLYPLGRVILRLEEILESRENEIEFFRELDRANRDILEGQKRRIDAAEDKIDALADNLEERKNRLQVLERKGSDA